MNTADNDVLGIVIIGAGFAGIGLAIRLKQSGRSDFAILERGADLGGVWRDNDYPGAACDIPSHLYSFSFEPKADWSHRFAPQAEILDYLRHCAGKYDIARHIRFGTEVAAAEFDARTGTWSVTTRSGELLRCRALITATGQLSRPIEPRLPGLDRFRGQCFHSARWRRDCELEGKRLAVVGTGASAIQFLPEVARTARHVAVFQRSPPYTVPRRDRRYRDWEKTLFRRVPLFLGISRTWIYLRYEARALALLGSSSLLDLMAWGFRRRLRRAVSDPGLRARLTPDYPFGCKRVLLTDDWFGTVLRDNVELVSEGIREVRERCIVTEDGRQHEADLIIFGTGFAATEFLAPMRVRGLGGLALEEVWRRGAEAYLGICVSGFPNLFMLYGPNTNLGHNSIIYMLESQFRYVLACLETLERQRLRYLDVRLEAQRRFNADLQARLERTVWGRGCSSWYLNAEGRNTNNWSSYTFRYRWRTRQPALEDYLLTR